MDRVFFVTTVCHERKPVFRNSRVCELFLQTTFTYRDQGRFRLHEFVLMPDHCHFLLTPAVLVSLEKVMQLIKGGFSHAVGRQLRRKAELWQRSFTNQHIGSADQYDSFRKYIHQNPVKERLCVVPAEYVYGSAHARWAMNLDPNPFSAGAKARTLPDLTHG